MRKSLSLLLVLSMVLGMASFAAAEPVYFESSAQGFGSQVKVMVDLENGKVVGLKVDDSGETYSAIGVTRMGAAVSIPKKDEVEERLAKF